MWCFADLSLLTHQHYMCAAMRAPVAPVVFPACGFPSCGCTPAGPWVLRPYKRQQWCCGLAVDTLSKGKHPMSYKPCLALIYDDRRM